MSSLNEQMLIAPFEDKKDQTFLHASDNRNLIPDLDKVHIQ